MANGNNFTSGGYRDYPRGERGNYGNDYGQHARDRDAADNGYYGRNGEYYDFTNDYGDRDDSSMARGWRREEENRGLRNEPNAPRYGQGGGFRSSERDWDRGYGDDRWSGNDRSLSYRDRGNSYRGMGSRSDYASGYGRYAGREDNDRRYDDYRGGQRGFWDKAGDEVASWFGDDDAERRRQRDEFRGKGPRNYQRSDTRILEDVNDRLSDDGRLDASDIEVSVSKCEVTLSGHVSNRSDKRRAEDLAERVSGVTHVQNNLRVKSGFEQTSQTSGSATSTGTGTAGSDDEKTSGRRLM